MSWWIRYIKRIQLQSLHGLHDHKRKLNSVGQPNGQREYRDWVPLLPLLLEVPPHVTNNIKRKPIYKQGK